MFRNTRGLAWATTLTDTRPEDDGQLLCEIGAVAWNRVTGAFIRCANLLSTDCT